MTTTAVPPGDTAGKPPSPPKRRRRHLARWIAGLVALALIVVAIVAATRPASQATEVASPLVGHTAPQLSGTTLSGQKFSLADESGSYVYVNFFASWCPPCQQEEATLIDFAFQQGKKTGGAKMISVVFNDSENDAKSFDAKWGVQWPVVPDSGGTLANRFGVGSPPMTFLIDPTGAVIGTWAGPVTVAQLDQMLNNARKGRTTTGGSGSGNG